MPKGSHSEPTPLLLNSPQSHIKSLILPHGIHNRCSFDCGLYHCSLRGLGSVSFNASEKSYNSGKCQDWFCLLLPPACVHIMPHFPFHLLSFSSPGCPVVPAPSLPHMMCPDSEGATKPDTSQLKWGPQSASCGPHSLNPEKLNTTYPHR